MMLASPSFQLPEGEIARDDLPADGFGPKRDPATTSGSDCKQGRVAGAAAHGLSTLDDGSRRAPGRFEAVLACVQKPCLPSVNNLVHPILAGWW